ncbi:hypothetical protein ACS8FD_08700 [Psychrobacter sp. 1U2]|uniref:hypothetical protein n=1 Tax=Psychrobacter sp. 1U2 TaxID=3453577 RepID=UPI003F47F02C
MSVLIGVGIATTVGVIYIGRKSWHALHKAVGITPGVLVYQDPNQALAPKDMRWRQLTLNPQHLASLTQRQLQQLRRIDNRVAVYSDYQQSLAQQNITATMTEQQFVLHKLLHTRLPEMLASYYHLVKNDTNYDNTITSNHSKSNQQDEAQQLLQAMLDNIEAKLESLLEQMENHHLQDLRIMKQYMDSQS